MITTVVITKIAERQARRSPKQVQAKLRAWVLAVETMGLEEVRKVPGWHDEPLRGNRKGQRSIRLSRQWRAIYVVASDGTIEFASVEEVLPHAY